jgi:hypothetical protein
MTGSDCNACEISPPIVMSDGRAFTAYAPNCAENVISDAPVMSSHARRMALTSNASTLREHEVRRAERSVMCFPPGAVGTTAEHALGMECDAHVCRVTPRPPGTSALATGTARVNTASMAPPMAFYASEGVHVGGGIQYSGYV